MKAAGSWPSTPSEEGKVRSQLVVSKRGGRPVRRPRILSNMKLIQKRLRTCSFARRGSPSPSVGLGQMLPLRWKTYRAAEESNSSILRISADTA